MFYVEDALQLVQEPFVDLCQIMNVVHRVTFIQRLQRNTMLT